MIKAAQIIKIQRVVLIALFLFIASVKTVLAQTFTAIPTRVDLSADPGQTVSTELKISNGTDKYLYFQIFVDDFVVMDEIGTPIPVQSNNTRWSLKNWITAPSNIPVDANSTQVVKISFKVPLTALPGGHYAMITYQPNVDLKRGEYKKMGNLIGQRVGTLLYLSVNGPVTQKAEVKKFTTAKFYEQGPVEFDGSILNLSDIHVNPKGKISIYSPLNSKLVDIPVEVGNVFPEASRVFKSVWNQKWGYGRYRADLNLAYGTAGSTLTSSVYFWLFPIRLVIYVLVLIVSILLAIILIGKRNKKHQDELEAEIVELKRELEKVDKK